MSTLERNKETVREVFEESLNKKNLDLLHDLFAADFVGTQGQKGPDGFRVPIGPLLDAVPDIHYIIKDLVAEDDKVVIRWTWLGTHTFAFRNIPATGKTISNEGMAVFVLKDGKIASANVQTDRLGFLQAVGALPADIPPPAAPATHTATPR